MPQYDPITEGHPKESYMAQRNRDLSIRDTDTYGRKTTVEEYQKVRVATKQLVSTCHSLSVAAGWWNDGVERNIPEALCLIHSEISEALEGVRKDKMDEHLPQHKSITIELADAIIRICDLAGGMNLPLGEALAEKLCYNQMRADHKKEHRAAAGGKKF